MKTSTLTKYATYAIAVLTATLLNQFILSYVKRHISEKGYLMVLVDMAVVVLVFAPAFALVVRFTKKLSKTYVRTSKNIGSTSRKGVILGIFVASILLFASYAYYRHGLNVIQDVALLVRVKMASLF